MVIAVDIKFKEAYQNFIYETFKRITSQHPQHSFIFIFDKPFDSSFIFSKNIIRVVIKPHRISILIDHKISSLLKKHKADVFVTAQSLWQLKVPQCLIAFDTITTKYLKKAKVIVATSEFLKKEIISKHTIDEGKIDVVYKAADEIFQPLTFKEKVKIKEQYADGYEFFLFTGTNYPEQNLLNLLKAFSVFKKMQKSNMQLLIASQVEISKEFLKTLQLYKFKNEVKIWENVDSKVLAEITATAYAFVYPLTKEYSIALRSMRGAVPVITGTAGVMPEICDDAALYFNTNDHKDIADKMMLIYKDENLRKQLIDLGKEQVKNYTWDKSASALWKSIEKANR